MMRFDYREYKVDTQTLINMVIGAAGFLGGWVLNRLAMAIDRLDSDLRKVQIEYVTKDDYFRDVREIKDMLKLIFDKLDSKADKQ